MAKSQSPHSKSFNLLLLGETGVGKSTFINGFANYLKFSTASEAEKGTLTSVIPTKFTVTDDKGSTKTVKIGNDKNESTEDEGQSQTQSCKAYLFNTSGRIIRLIDTPGIGDTRGLAQDRSNGENILTFVSHYAAIHGILILLKPNHSRLDTSFRFCVKELLCRLHKKASDNIVFVFTNSRGTSFKPQDTLSPLKELLQEIKNSDSSIDIQVTTSRTYCLDNEGFRYIVANKQGITFPLDDVVEFNRSWMKSADEVTRLVNYVVALEPHLVTDMVSINDARRMVVAFSKPLGDITQLILVNISVIEDQRDKIAAAGADHDKLRALQEQDELYVPKVEIETDNCGLPITVCSSSSCTDISEASGIAFTVYPQKCHDPCYLKDITPQVIKNEGLRHCAAMSGENCIECGCNWRQHMHIYSRNLQFRTAYTHKEELTDKVQSLENVIEKSEKIIVDLNKQRTELEREKREITRISALFAQFLRQNSLTSYNDAVEDYLEHLIEAERSKASSGKKQVMKELEDMKKAYVEEKQILEKEMNKADCTDRNITPNAIKNYTRELFTLPIHGPKLKKMVLEFEDATRKEHENFTQIFL